MDIDEKRIYGAAREETVAYLATGQGVATVEISGDQVGRFGLAHQGMALDVAIGNERVYAATDTDVVCGDGETFERVEFGAAEAVTVDATPLAADEKGWVSRYADGEWSVVDAVETVRALDRDLVAAPDGVYRVTEGDLAYVGLDAATDVAAAGVPLAATEDGLYRLGNGWQHLLDGSFTTVAADADHAHAATADQLYAYDEEIAGWRTCSLPVSEPVVDVAYGECVYVVTADGTLLVDADEERTPDGADGWRARSLGLPDVAAMAVQ